MNPGRHAVAVAIVTTCRASLARAVRSVFRQRLADGQGGRIQVLLGVDCDPDGRLATLLDELAPECPPHVTVTLINLGYSTSRRHGGPHASYYGGSLRSALTLLADSRVVVYLDDDDWLKEDHCARILQAIDGKKWAYSYSIYADGNTGQELCVDGLESVGVGRGIYAETFGGLYERALLYSPSFGLSPQRFADNGQTGTLGELKLKISGCINACGHHHAGHIGILGVDKKGTENYQLLLGGSEGDDTSLGKITGPGFDEDGIVDAVEKATNVYLAQKQEGERFLDTYRRIGMDPFKEAIYA